MAKPIFIAEIPLGQSFDRTKKFLESRLYDYHILVIPTNSDDFNFKVFYEKDFTEIELNDLKEFIKNRLKSSTKVDNVKN